MNEDFMNENNDENVKNDNLSDNNQSLENAEKPASDSNDKQLSYFAKILIIIITVFLATFCAVYLVIDANMYKLGITPFTVTTDQIEKIFDKEADFIEKTSPAPVKIETKNDKYIVTVSLKSFDNNPDNVQIETTSNGIKISGNYKKNTKNNTSEHSFYQNVIFPNKIDTNLIKKENKKSSIIINLPFIQGDVQEESNN